MSSNTPVAEFDVDSALVLRLLLDQHPDLAHLPLAALASGWDNAIFRLGDALTVRMPRRQLGAELIRHEQRWLPVLAPTLPLPTPCPLRVGRPALGYPWHWSICPWLPITIFFCDSLSTTISQFKTTTSGCDSSKRVI